MIPIGLGIFIIVAFVVIGIIYAKMVFIWRDVMLNRNNKNAQEISKIKK